MYVTEAIQAPLLFTVVQHLTERVTGPTEEDTWYTWRFIRTTYGHEPRRYSLSVGKDQHCVSFSCNCQIRWGFEVSSDQFPIDNKFNIWLISFQRSAKPIDAFLQRDHQTQINNHAKDIFGYTNIFLFCYNHSFHNSEFRVKMKYLVDFSDSRLKWICSVLRKC